MAVERIFGILEQNGGDQYDGEAVSQLEHALQCAYLAEHSGAPTKLVVAALLHDIGHLIHKPGDVPAERGVDDRHEALGRAFLAKWFDDCVTEPVALHVDAKRYLCATDSAYYKFLSTISVRSLELQGGPFSPAEASAFLARPHARDALSVRRWDEQAKDPALRTPRLQQRAASTLMAEELPQMGRGTESCRSNWPGARISIQSSRLERLSTTMRRLSVRSGTERMFFQSCVVSVATISFKPSRLIIGALSLRLSDRVL